VEAKPDDPLPKDLRTRKTDKRVWKVDTIADFDVRQNFFGVGSTPVVEGDLLIAPGRRQPKNDPARNARHRPKGSDSGIVAFDKYTGKVRYHVTNELASYAGPVLATVGGWGDGLVRLRSLENGEVTTTLEEHRGILCQIAFMPDGKRLVSAATIDRGERESRASRYRGEIKLWDIAKEKEVGTLHGHEERLECLCCSPDGGMLATGDNDGLTKLWDVQAKKELATLGGHRGPNTTIVGLAFSRMARHWPRPAWIRRSCWGMFGAARSSAF